MLELLCRLDDDLVDGLVEDLTPADFDVDVEDFFSTLSDFDLVGLSNLDDLEESLSFKLRDVDSCLLAKSFLLDLFCLAADLLDFLGSICLELLVLRVLDLDQLRGVRDWGVRGRGEPISRS